jgi:hypothetical protein
MASQTRLWAQVMDDGLALPYPEPENLYQVTAAELGSNLTLNPKP